MISHVGFMEKNSETKKYTYGEFEIGSMYAIYVQKSDNSEVLDGLQEFWLSTSQDLRPREFLMYIGQGNLVDYLPSAENDIKRYGMEEIFFDVKHNEYVGYCKEDFEHKLYPFYGKEVAWKIIKKEGIK